MSTPDDLFRFDWPAFAPAEEKTPAEAPSSSIADDLDALFPPYTPVSEVQVDLETHRRICRDAVHYEVFGYYPVHSSTY